jgi:putative ABC transport system permease protein
MLRNYLKTAWRHFRRRPGTAALNAGGLAVALAACLLIGLYVQKERSYDRFHDGADRIFRVVKSSGDSLALGEDGLPPAGIEGNAATPPGLAQVAQQRFPAVQYVTEVGRLRDVLLASGPKRFSAEKVARADTSFFAVFDGFELQRGDPENALDAPRQIVLSPSLAKRLFGDENPVGRTVRVENRADYEVSGVLAEVPAASHFRPNALLSLTQRQRGARDGQSVKWRFFGDYLYAKLRPGSDPATLQQGLSALVEEAGQSENFGLALQPLTAIRLYSQVGGEIAPQSDARYLWLFGAIGAVLLLIACINYANLATARSAERALEAGIRRTVGARREQLAGQFLGEAVLTAALALPAAVLLARAARPLVQRWTGQTLPFEMLFGGPTLLGLLGAVVGVGLISGLYPAVALSRFSPAQVLRGGGRGGRSAGGLRRGLVAFQFAATVALIAAALVVQQQLGYVQEKRLGFDEERVVTFDTGELDDQYDAFKQTLAQSGSVARVTSGSPPGLGRQRMSMTRTDSATGEQWRLYVMQPDYGFAETMGLDVVAGRSFQRARDDTGQVVMVNQRAMRKLGLGDAPVGKRVALRGEQRRVVGVFRNFHNRSLREEQHPLLLVLRPGNHYTGLAKLRAGRIEEGLADLEAAWNQFLPDRPFEATFLDERIAAQYRSERRLARLFGGFAGLAVFVACLGLFGLAAFSAEARSKEVAIRKTFGASARQVVALLSKDFLKLVGVGFVLAVPVAWYAMRQWLEGFAYHVELGPGVFLAAGAAALAVAAVTVSTQAWRAARTNPAQALRDE